MLVREEVANIANSERFLFLDTSQYIFEFWPLVDSVACCFSTFYSVKDLFLSHLHHNIPLCKTAPHKC